MMNPEQSQQVDLSEKQLAIPEIQFEADPELVKDGWERRFMAALDQIEDTLRLYTELGFEVHKEPVKPAELSVACGDCRLATCRTYVTIYTRKRENKNIQNA